MHAFIYYSWSLTLYIVLLPLQIAARLRVAANEKAEAEKILQIKRAEGDAESKYLAGLGIARQRQAIVDGLRDSVLAFSENVPGTTSKDIMDMVLMTQYFDTMKDIGASSKSNAVFIPHGPGAVQDVASQIRNGLLQGNATQSWRIDITYYYSTSSWASQPYAYIFSTTSKRFLFFIYMSLPSLSSGFLSSSILFSLWI